MRHVPLNDGAIYDPRTDTWQSLCWDSSCKSPNPQPVPHPGGFGYGTASSDTQMLVWSGTTSSTPWNFSLGADTMIATGGLYTYAWDQWQPITSDNAPSPRVRAGTVWTGKQFVVWGGWDSDIHPLADGGIYDPFADRWTKIAPPPFADDVQFKGAPSRIVWTGSRVLIWGVYFDRANSVGVNLGALYDPETDHWDLIEPKGLSFTFYGSPAQGMWNGSQMLLWGGDTPLPNTPTPDYPTAGSLYRPACSVDATLSPPL